MKRASSKSKRSVIARYYPMQMPCSYRVQTGAGWIQSGSGRTIEISGQVAKFRPDGDIARDATEIELSMPWPVTLPDGARLKLVLTGKPIWAGIVLAGILIQKHEFRTRAKIRPGPETVRAFRCTQAAAGRFAAALPAEPQITRNAITAGDPTGVYCS